MPEAVVAQGLSSAMQARMNFLIERQGVVAGNIANAATPDYIAKDLTFVGKVKKATAMMQTSGKHISAGGFIGHGVETEDKLYMKNNGNSVDTATEMLKLNEIQTEYTMMVQLRSKHVSMYRMALGRQ